MIHHCPACLKEFLLDSPASFCPFCGISLHSEKLQVSEAISNREINLDAQSFYSHSKERIIEQIIKKIKEQLRYKTNYALLDIDLVEANVVNFDMQKSMNRCLRQQDGDKFFEQVERELDQLEEFIREEIHLEDHTVCFNDFYNKIAQLDQDVIKVLRALNKEIELPPLEKIPLESKILIHSLSKEQNLTIHKCLRNLAAKVKKYVDDHYVLIYHYAVAFDLNENFAKIEEEDSLQQVIDKLNVTYPKTLAGIEKVNERKYIYDFLSYQDDLADMMTTFWNAFYQLSEYSRRRVEVKYHCGDKECFPLVTVKGRLDKHYSHVNKELERMKIEMRSLSEMELQNHLLALTDKFTQDLEELYKDIFE